MRTLSPQTRQKLAILLKARAASQGMPEQGAPAPGLNGPSPASVSIGANKPSTPGMPNTSTVQPAPLMKPSKPVFTQGKKELDPRFFNLKKKLGFSI